ncbi:GntR family transcriptional regulator [Orrella daihaiensis]|uniref:GntR family transcriptional regulator n=1 Tax=Orrella daihaiensis TaxID=2782176 RepID=A0ABY4AIL1_9BURK|nr:GntR family transcriptional regulator [Orrella daihaiensis]UOD50127.1 GntR family transcriptional regulator [Orrella daihaiensis]
MPKTCVSHADLVRHLAEEIAAGRYTVGSLLPTEFELCATHRLSRYAVRKALQELQALGLISRRKNVGTRVEAAHPVTGFRQSIATIEELVQFGARHRRVLKSTKMIVADEAVALEIGCEGGSRWLRVSSLRMDAQSESHPICWTDVYIDAAFKDIAKWVCKAPEVLISSLIEEHYGQAILRIRQEAQAILMPTELAADLQAEVGSPALKVTRHYFNAAGDVVEISISVHPADRFTLSMEMTRSYD